MYHNKYQLDTNDMSGLIATEQTTEVGLSTRLSVHEYLSIFTFVHLILFIIK